MSEKVVIVTGSRIWRLETLVWVALTFHEPKLVVHGTAEGPDTFAERWAKQRGVDYHGMPAWWRRDAAGNPAPYDNAAGHKRNDRMLRHYPGALVLAFPAGEAKGTRGCVARAMQLGHEVWIYDEQGNHVVRKESP